MTHSRGTPASTAPLIYTSHHTATSSVVIQLPPNTPPTGSERNQTQIWAIALFWGLTPAQNEQSHSFTISIPVVSPSLRHSFSLCITTHDLQHYVTLPDRLPLRHYPHHQSSYTPHRHFVILSPHPTTAPTTHTRIDSEGILRTQIRGSSPLLET